MMRMTVRLGVKVHCTVQGRTIGLTRSFSGFSCCPHSSSEAYGDSCSRTCCANSILLFRTCCLEDVPGLVWDLLKCDAFEWLFRWTCSLGKRSWGACPLYSHGGAGFTMSHTFWQLVGQLEPIPSWQNTCICACLNCNPPAPVRAGTLLYFK